MKFTEKAFEPLDQEEKDLMESIEKGEWQPVKNLKREKEAAMQAARNTHGSLQPKYNEGNRTNP